MAAAKIAFLAAVAAVAHAADDSTIGFGPAFSLGPTQSWIREANTTIVLPKVPSPQVDRLALWPGMGTSGGDLIQALAVAFTDPGANCDGATEGQWCIWASTLQDTQLGGKMVPADAGDQVTMHYVFNDDTSEYDQTVFLNGKQVSTLSTSSGQAQGWGTAVECQAQACTGTALAHKYIDTTVILNEADTTFAGTLGINEVDSTGLKTEDNKVFTVETINVQAHTYSFIRFAAPPTGVLRWQPPQPPAVNRTLVRPAVSYGPICPQSFNAVPGNEFVLGDEDCLYLNVYAPPNAENLPVLVWIHGGGYGFFNGQQDLSSIVSTNNNTFIGVGIQYRLGAFGFLSSDEVARRGALNAGLLDQQFALEWIQQHIEKFGGDPSRVTIAGLSAGAGSVMLHTIAYGGTLGTSLFTSAIAASPYLPTQYKYNDFLPTQAYYAFAGAAGCPANFAYGNTTETVFECLQSQDTLVLQQASNKISTSGTFGSWGFLPVTDGHFIRERPSQALLKRKVNGLMLLTSNTAEEGPAYTPQTIASEEDLIAWLLHTFPLLDIEDANKILYYYPFVPSSDNTTFTYPTAGDSGSTAISTSQIASGHQQRANLILGETTFMCPSYWLATAFSSPSTGHHSYKYQYSIPTALHGYDLEAYFGPPRRNQGTDLLRALQLSWGNFVRFGDPSIPSSIATGADDAGPEPHPLEHWPEFSTTHPLMVDFNQTGGTPYEFTAVQVRNDGPLTVVGDSDRNVTLHSEPGLRNDFRVVDAYAWEGGRGARCDFWRSIGPIVPE